MTQHDMDVANQGYSALRGDINGALVALATNNAGASAPSTTFANMWWPDTTNGVMKQRNNANNAWNIMYPLGNDGMFVMRYAGSPQGNVAAWFVGQICLDTTNKQMYVATVADGTTGGSTWKRDVFYNANLPTRYHGSAPPRHSSGGTQYILDYILERDESDTYNIVKNTATTLNLGVTGLNGVATSSNLAGTIGTGGSSSTTITGSGTAFLSDYAVGDVISCSAGSRRVTAIASDTSLTVSSAITISNGTSYWRGGSLGVWLYLYVIYKPSDGSVGVIVSTRDVSSGQTLVDLPSGYTNYRQLAWAVLNSSLIQYVTDGWPWNPTIVYDAQFAAPGDTNASLHIDNGNATSFTQIETRSTSVQALPKIAKAVCFYVSANTGALQFYTRPNGSSSNGRRYNLNGANDDVYTSPVILNDNGQWDYKVSGNSVDVSIYGWTAFAK